jgi:hypothetical protein
MPSYLNKVMLIGRVTQSIPANGNHFLVTTGAKAWGQDATPTVVIPTNNCMLPKCRELAVGKLVFVEGSLTVGGVVATAVRFLSDAPVEQAQPAV